MAHFNPLKWIIELPEIKMSDLDHDANAQARFVHEYVHYVQTLTGTIGRYILVKVVRLAISAGIMKKYGWPPPSNYEQIYLLEVLKNSVRSDFKDSEPAKRYHKLSRELEFVLADTWTSFAGTVDFAHPFVRETLKVGKFQKDKFVHVVVTDACGGLFKLPMTDRVVFENMARQVQRNYLMFNNQLNTSTLDAMRQSIHRDLTYVCLHDYIKRVLPEGEDPAKWTITLCQFALLCRNPGTAFERIYQQLVSARITDLQAFIQHIVRDSWFTGEFNVPPIQEVLDELIGKWGTVMLLRENWELREFTKCIANASNALIDNYSFFASPLLTWREVGQWIVSFGCPPIFCADGRREELHGIATSMPWHDYFRLTDKLLSE